MNGDTLQLTGWNMLGHEGFEPVRMVAIDEDWSAKRFRRRAVRLSALASARAEMPVRRLCNSFNSKGH